MIYVKLPEDKSEINLGMLAGAKYIKFAEKAAGITGISNIPTVLLMGDVIDWYNLSNIVACAIDTEMFFNIKLSNPNIGELEFNSMQEALALMGLSELPALAWERITKEEFYDLNA